MGLLSLAETRAREALGSPWSDDRWWTTLGRRASSGIDVKSEDAVGLSAVWNALWIVGMSLATIKVKVYQKRENERGRDVVRDHPVHKRLNWRPNPWMRPYNYLSTAQVHTMVFGTSFTQKVTDGRNSVTGLVPLHPRRMKLSMRRGELIYTYRREDGTAIEFAQDEIMHISGLAPTGILGYNPMELNSEAIGSSLAVERHKGAFFKNYAQTSLVAEHPGKLGDKAYKRLQESIGGRSGGSIYRPMVVEEGMKVHSLGLNAQDAQLIEAARLQIAEVARITNVPVPMLKDDTRSTFNNIEHKAIEFVTHTIRPWVVIWQQALETDLLTEEERESGLIVRFSLESLLQGDKEAQASWFRQMHDMGVYSPNDIRVLLDENPYEGGDVYTLQVNRLPIDQLGQFGESTDEPPPEPESDERAIWSKPGLEDRSRRSLVGRRQATLAHRRVLQRVFARLTTREVAAAREALSQGEEGDFTEFEQWLRTFYSQFTPEVRQSLRPVIGSLAVDMMTEALAEVGSEDDVSDQLDAFVRDYSDTLVIRYTSKSKNTLRKRIREAPDDVAAHAAVSEELDHWEETRAAWEAEKEVHRASNATTVAVYGFIGVAAYRWVTIGKNCPLCNKLDGRQIQMGGAFLDKGDTLEAEGANPLTARTTTRHPPAHASCDCSVAAI